MPQTRFKRTWEALLSTYWKDARAPEIFIQGALQRAFERALAVHGSARIDADRLDRAFAGEVFYQFTRGRTFRCTEAALSKCWWNLITERSEKFLPSGAQLVTRANAGAQTIGQIMQA